MARLFNRLVQSDCITDDIMFKKTALFSQGAYNLIEALYL